MSEITLPAEYSYVLAVGVVGVLVNQWHSIVVSGARKKASVPYPNAYVPHEQAPVGSDNYVFNCAQRAHSNFLENMPQFYVLMFTAGLQHPKLASGFGMVYLIGRIIYNIGYRDTSKAGGKGRLRGGPLYGAGLIGLLGTASYTCYQLITSIL